jgi:hypothetical protein
LPPCAFYFCVGIIIPTAQELRTVQSPPVAALTSVAVGFDAD